MYVCALTVVVTRDNRPTYLLAVLQRHGLVIALIVIVMVIP